MKDDWMARPEPDSEHLDPATVLVAIAVGIVVAVLGYIATVLAIIALG